MPLLRLLLFFAVCIFFQPPRPAQAQVGVIPEAAPEPEYSEMTMGFSGQGCDVNRVESAVLHVKGVIEVDLQTNPGQMIIRYRHKKLTPEQIKAAVGKKLAGCLTSTVDVKVEAAEVAGAPEVTEEKAEEKKDDKKEGESKK